MGDGKSDPEYDAQLAHGNEAGYIPPGAEYPKRSIEEAAARLQPEIERELNQLEKIVAYLIDNVDGYLQQLSPILAPERDEIQETVTEPANEVYPRSQVGERIRASRDRLTSLNYRVHSTKERTSI